MATITIEQAKQRITKACDRLPREVFRELAKRVVDRTPAVQAARLVKAIEEGLALTAG